MVAAPPAPRLAFNGADLHYLRGALLALTDARGASDVAAAEASDPRVRALARRAAATQAGDIRAITSLLVGWSQHEAVPAQAAQVAPVTPPASAASDLRSRTGLEVDLRFLEILTAHTEASLASARTEMVEGFGGSSRRHAEAVSRTSWRELTAISSLTPGRDRGVGRSWSPPDHS